MTVVSNDPENPKLMLTLEGQIIVDVEVQPRAVGFRQLLKGDPATSEFTVRVVEPDKVKLGEMKVDDERFTVAPKEGAPDVFVMSFSGAQELGRIQSRLTISYSGEKSGEVKIPVSAQIVGDLRYSKNVYFSKRQGSYEPREIVFTTRSGKPVKLKGAEDPSGRLSVEITANAGDKSVLTAAVKDQGWEPERPERGTLTVQTTDPDEPVVEIGYTVSGGATALRRGMGKGQIPSVRPMLPTPPHAINPPSTGGAEVQPAAAETKGEEKR